MMKQSSLDNLENIFEYVEIPSWLYDVWDWWIGWFTDIPSSAVGSSEEMGCAFGLHCKVLAASSRLWVAWTFYEMEFYVCFAIERCLFSSCTCTGFVIKTQIWSLCFFRCRIRWEFESPVIPLLSKIAPSDVILVRSLPAVQRFWSLGCERNVPFHSEEITQVTLAMCLREAGELLAFGLNLGLLEKKLGETENI